MANKSTAYPFLPFDHTKFDSIKSESDGKNTMEQIEKFVEEERKNIFDVLSTGRANGNNDTDEKSLKNMKDVLDEKKEKLEKHLGEVTVVLNLKNDNNNLISFCKYILDAKDPAKVNSALAGECGNLLSTLQNVYTKGSRKEKLFSGKKDDASDDFADLIEPDVFSDIINAPDEATLKTKIDEFVKKTFSPHNNSFGIARSKLYTPPKSEIEQAKVAARIAIFLHCMKKALEEGRIDKANATKVKLILKQLKDEQIPKIRGLYNLKKEKEAVDAEYETLLDIRKNDKTPIDRKDTTTSIDLTSSFEGKSTDKAKEIDFYNLNKNGIKITIGSTVYSTSDIILKDSSGEISELNKTIGSSGDYALYLKISGSEVKLGELCVNYDDSKKALFVLKSAPDLITNLSTKGITGDVNVEIPIMAVKNVGTPRTKTGQVSLSRTIKALLKGSITPPPPPTPDTELEVKDAKEREATITNVDQINRAIAEREAEEELEQRYEKVGWNIFDRANLFFRRKFIKDKIVSKKLGKKSGFDWSESAKAAAHRHQIEKEEDLADNLKELVNIDEKNYPVTRGKLDTLIADVTGNSSTIPPWENGIDEDQFKIRFEDILKQSGIAYDNKRPSTATIRKWKPISKIIKSNNINSLSTNIYRQAEQFQAHQKMVYNIYNHLRTTPSETDEQFYNWCKGEINRYITKYDNIPDFLNQLKRTSGENLSLDNKDDIKILKGNDAALLAIQSQSMKYRLQVLDRGGEAYNVKKKGGVLTKIGRFLDDPTLGENTRIGRWMNKHQNIKEVFGRVWGTAKVSAMVLPSMFIFSPIGPLTAAGWVGGTSFLTTLFKKRSHYEEEHKSYLRAQANNVEDYRKKRKDLADEVAGMKRYQGRFWGENKKNRDQYEQYVFTSHDQLELSSNLYNEIRHYLKKGIDLDIYGKGKLRQLLEEGLARLDYHKETGQNFLGSNNQDESEKEYMQLQNAIMGGSLRLGILTSSLRGGAFYRRHMDLLKEGTGNDYNTQGYIKAKKRFGRRKWGKSVWGALKAGSISAGLSYLASSMASTNEIKIDTKNINVDKNVQNIGGQYNLGDRQEHNFVVGDVNPAMNNVINNDTIQIRSGTLYSSVDSVPCSADKGSEKLLAAKADLSNALSNHIVSSNRDLVSAVNNYVDDATTKISGISGLSAGNRDLSIARAIEAAKEGILEPIISSRNTSISIDPTCLSWENPGTIQTAGGSVGQSFRNMGIANLDYVQKGTEFVPRHVVRAITIPVPGFGNTFGSPKSKVA